MLEHVKQGDYFGTLATVLSLLDQKNPDPVLEDIIKDLVELQEEYEIRKKE